MWKNLNHSNQLVRTLTFVAVWWPAGADVDPRTFCTLGHCKMAVAAKFAFAVIDYLCDCTCNYCTVCPRINVLIYEDEFLCSDLWQGHGFWSHLYW